jgi:hypothetical protein
MNFCIAEIWRRELIFRVNFLSGDACKKLPVCYYRDLTLKLFIINSFPQNIYGNTEWFQCLYKNYQD